MHTPDTQFNTRESCDDKIHNQDEQYNYSEKYIKN